MSISTMIQSAISAVSLDSHDRDVTAARALFDEFDRINRERADAAESLRHHAATTLQAITDRIGELNEAIAAAIDSDRPGDEVARDVCQMTIERDVVIPGRSPRVIRDLINRRVALHENATRDIATDARELCSAMRPGALSLAAQLCRNGESVESALSHAATDDEYILLYRRLPALAAQAGGRSVSDGISEHDKLNEKLKGCDPANPADHGRILRALSL